LGYDKKGLSKTFETAPFCYKSNKCTNQGRGNVWPVVLGQEHTFYNRLNYEDLANASCSIIKSKNLFTEDILCPLLRD